MRNKDSTASGQEEGYQIVHGPSFSVPKKIENIEEFFKEEAQKIKLKLEQKKLKNLKEI